MGAVGFWYNKDLFAQAGIEAPPTTWSEFLEVIKTLKAAGITPIALGEGDKWPGAFYWEYLAVRIGGQAAFDAAYSRQGAFTDAPFVEAGVKLQELVALEPFQEGFLGATWPDEQVVMATEKAAMDLMGQLAPGAFKDASVDKQGLGDKLGWFPSRLLKAAQEILPMHWAVVTVLLSVRMQNLKLSISSNILAVWNRKLPRLRLAYPFLL